MASFVILLIIIFFTIYTYYQSNEESGRAKDIYFSTSQWFTKLDILKAPRISPGRSDNKWTCNGRLQNALCFLETMWVWKGGNRMNSSRFVLVSSMWNENNELNFTVFRNIHYWTINIECLTQRNIFKICTDKISDWKSRLRLPVDNFYAITVREAANDDNPEMCVTDVCNRGNQGVTEVIRFT